MAKPVPKSKCRQVACDYCGSSASLVLGDMLYDRADLWTKHFWLCAPCKAWVGCHAGTDVPLGRLADARLRRAKMEAHAVFDPLWIAKSVMSGLSKNEARGRAYAWLADQLGVPRAKAHIGMLDEASCVKVKTICYPHFVKINRPSRGSVRHA
jgi:hypothetical protein